MPFNRRWLLLALLLLLLTACSLTTSPEKKSTPIPTNTAEPQQMPIVYYYFASIPGNTFPAGSVVIVPDVLILSPTLSDIPRSADAAQNVQSAVQAALNDPRNVWTGGATIASVTVDGNHAAVALNGEITGVGDAVLIAARMQFLMTVFAEPSIQTTTITINGQNVGNLGISHSSEEKPDDYAHTRVEIETFMAQNAYES